MKIDMLPRRGGGVYLSARARRSAGDSEGGPVANTAFTELPGVIAQAPGQSASAFAQGQAVPGTNGTVIQQRGAALQYAPSPYQGPSS